MSDKLIYIFYIYKFLFKNLSSLNILNDKKEMMSYL